MIRTELFFGVGGDLVRVNGKFGVGAWDQLGVLVDIFLGGL